MYRGNAPYTYVSERCTGCRCEGGDIVSVKADNERGTIFNQVKIRVDDSFTLEMHIDTDEANAAKIATGNTVTIIK